VGQNTFIGAGSVVIPGIKIGNNVTIGAGSTVLNDIQDNAKVAGTPARGI
jgi:acetyltransferase-like isoleucine patch superfamily enzyme